jgi:hypothetical protein
MPAFRFDQKTSYLSVLILLTSSFSINVEISVTGLYTRLQISQFMLTFYSSYFCSDQPYRFSLHGSGFPVFEHGNKISVLIPYFNRTKVHGYAPYFEQHHANITLIDHSRTFTLNNISLSLPL